MLSDLGLNNVRNSPIGNQFRRGISGGEKKRVSIGCELVTDPSTFVVYSFDAPFSVDILLIHLSDSFLLIITGLIFLDEPTTGLDAANSLNVMTLLNQLTKQGRTVICTIHQPRSTIFDLFDQLMLLSRGRVVYFGPARDAVTYFAALDRRCRAFLNPADFFLDCLVDNERKALANDRRLTLTEEDDKEAVSNELPELITAYERSALSDQVNRTIEDTNTKAPPDSRGRVGDARMAMWPVQVFRIAQRATKNILRNPMTSYVQLFQTLFMAFLISSLYWQIGVTQESIQNRTGSLFFTVTNVTPATFLF